MEAQRLLGIVGLLATLCMAHAETREWLATAHDYTVQVNQLRLQHNLPPLKLNAQLCDAAQAYAETLAQTGVIAHADAHGRRADYRASATGYFYHRLGENLAAGQPTWERALHAWLNSPDHRANLLTADYRELGIGFAGSASRYRTVWAQLLGARRTAYPVIINLDAFATDTPEVVVYVHGAREAHAMRYYLQGGIVLAQVAGDGERNHQRRPCLLERTGAGVERAARSEHIVQQPHRAPAHALGTYSLERIAHILQALGLTQPHLRTAVEPPTEPTCLHGDA
jgi:hypothetical protein